MANTTFKGTLRSEGGYSSIATNSTTGAETTQMSVSSAGFASLDAASADIYMLSTYYFIPLFNFIKSVLYNQFYRMI